MREHPELDRQRGAQPSVHGDRVVTSPFAERSAHDLSSRSLVQRIELEHAIPLTTGAQQIEVPVHQEPPRFVRPRFVSGARQQLTRVEKRRGTRRNSVPRGERPVGSLEELVDVGVHGDARKQRHVQLLQDNRVRVRERLAGMVCGLAQVRAARRRVELRPERVDDLIARKLATRRKCEQLDQLTSATGRELRHCDSIVDGQLETAEEADVHVPDRHLHLPLLHFMNRADIPL